MFNIFSHLIVNNIFNLYIILFFIFVIYSALSGFKLYNYLRKKYYDIWLEATKGGFVWGEKLFQLYILPPLPLKEDVIFNRLRKKYFISIIIIITFFVFIIASSLSDFLL